MTIATEAVAINTSGSVGVTSHVHKYMLAYMNLIICNVLVCCRLDWDRWLTMGLIGVSIGCVGILLHQFLLLIAGTKWETAERLMHVTTRHTIPYYNITYHETPFQKSPHHNLYHDTMPYHAIMP